MASITTERDSLSAYGEARSTIEGAPLDPDELRLLDTYWRASHYLGLGVIYLKDNPLPCGVPGPEPWNEPGTPGRAADRAITLDHGSDPPEEVMQVPDFTLEHLKALPLRAIVAFAARCARRVEPLAQLPEGHPQREGRRRAVEAALGVAEAFAGGADGPPDESAIAAIDASRDVAGGPAGSADAAAAAAEAARAASLAWELTSPVATDRRDPLELKTAEARKFLGAVTHATTDVAALAAFTAAVDAFTSVGYHNDGFVNATLDDYDRLLRLELGRYPEPGQPIDPSPGGPLGPL